jgi:hypothetical protein
MACENCDYTDIIIPMDYTLSAFRYANRKQYNQWKMIGIQATHTFLHNGVNGIGIKVDDSGRLVGIASGCKVIEEVNQNNHIIGRGAWYLRAKSDGGATKDGGTNSAGYGIMGHCQSPGIEGPQGDASFNVKQTAWSIEGYGYSTSELLNMGLTKEALSQNGGAFFRGWGSKQGTEFCSAAGASDWHMAVFFEYTKSYDGQKDQYMQYYADEDCAKKCEFASDKKKCTCICRANNSQLPGRFTAWICVDDLSERVYRTCEALNYRLGGVEGRYDMLHSSKLCLDATNSIFSSNDILGTSSKDIAKDLAYAPMRVLGIGDGVMVKLTSLPTCNHFDKVIVEKGSYNESKIKDGEEQIVNTQYENKFRCERGVIRLAPQCFAAVSAGPVRAIKSIHFDTIEKHYDRWDRSDKSNLKIFDEVFTLQNGIKVRVLAHHKDEIMKYYGDGVFRADYTKDKWLTKKYLTGGHYADGPTGQKGCECNNSSDGTNSAYPIRPYNNFTYCANNFTCEKTCTGNANPSPPSTPGPGDPGYTPGG